MRTILAIGLVSLLVSTSAFGGANSGVAKVAVHVVDHSSRSCSKNMPTITSCEDIITTNAGYNVDFFPVFFDLVEYQGIEYGVTWNGSSCTFTSCSDLTIGDIVNAGDGVSHAWSECQSGPVAIPGFGWIYSYGSICIVPHPAAGGPNIGDCAAPDPQIDQPVANYCAGTNGLQGDDPCAPIATEATTWGSIKSMFR